MICLSFDGDKDNDDDDGEVDGSDIDDGSANGNGGGSNDGNYKNNDLIVIPMSKAPGSDNHNGDSMVVTMILKKTVMMRPMSRTPSSDQKIGDTQVDQVEVDCSSHVPATKSSTSTSSTTTSSHHHHCYLLRTTERMTRIFPMPAKQTRTTTADNRARAWRCGDDYDRASLSDFMFVKNFTATFGYYTFKYSINCVVLLCWQKI